MLVLRTLLWYLYIPCPSYFNLLMFFLENVGQHSAPNNVCLTFDSCPFFKDVNKSTILLTDLNN